MINEIVKKIQVIIYSTGRIVVFLCDLSTIALQFVGSESRTLVKHSAGHGVRVCNYRITRL